MSMELFKHIDSMRNGQAILSRLRWIEGRLTWIGEFNRNELVQRFGISKQQASADINLYSTYAPTNFAFHHSQKVFLTSTEFEPIFEHEPINWLQQEQDEVDGLNVLSLEDVRGIPQKIQASIFRTLNKCRKHKVPAKITMGSFASDEAIEDVISLHSVVITPVRWHIRSWSKRKKQFADIPISRILEAKPIPNEDWVSMEADSDWHEQIPIILAPADGTGAVQRKMIATAYGMVNGRVEINTRKCLVYYSLAAMQLLNAVREYNGVALNPDLKIKVVNYLELLPLVKSMPPNNDKIQLDILRDIKAFEQSKHHTTIAASLKKNMIRPVWIGSGFAKMAACFANDLCKVHGMNSTFESPLDYRFSSKNPSDLPILITFSGKGEDAIDTAKNMATFSKQCGIISCQRESKALEVLGESLAYYSFGEPPARDDRFVNIRSIFALASLVERYLESVFKIECNNTELETLARQAEIISNKAARNIGYITNPRTKQLIILGKGYNNAFQHMWTSILSEAGIATPIWADIKDFTHGDHRNISLQRNHVFLLLDTPEISLFNDIFEKRFSQCFTVERISLAGDYRTQFWMSLFCAVYFTHHLSCTFGYDGLRPPKDELIHSWRGWGRLT